MRVDRLIGRWAEAGKKRVRRMFDEGLVRVNGQVVESGVIEVGKFDRVEVGDEVVQARVRRVVLMNKPAGVVSATVDEEHETVIDLLGGVEWAGEMHLAGRLDRFTTGLVILTNDSLFSEGLTAPEKKVGKRYLVEVDGVITDEVVRDFKAGVWFAKEEVWTQPAVVEMLSDRVCRMTIFEGKHHQVKRMFARHELRVVSLHREAIGGIELPQNLREGDWRVVDGIVSALPVQDAGSWLKNRDE